MDVAKPIPTSEIPPDTYVVLECQCSGVRGATTATEIPVMIVTPCPAHTDRQWASHWLQDWELATPVPRGRERLFARWRRDE